MLNFLIFRTQVGIIISYTKRVPRDVQVEKDFCLLWAHILSVFLISIIKILKFYCHVLLAVNTNRTNSISTWKRRIKVIKINPLGSVYSVQRSNRNNDIEVTSLESLKVGKIYMQTHKIDLFDNNIKITKSLCHVIQPYHSNVFV